MKTDAETIWIICDKKTGEPMRSPCQKKISFYSEKPTAHMLHARSFSYRSDIIARAAVLLFLDKDVIHE